MKSSSRKSPLVEITKDIYFETAHYLCNPKWDRKKNLAVFGKCCGYRADDPSASGLPHGHAYRLQVKVKGPVDPATGYVLDFGALKNILDREVDSKYDHRFINREVEPFKDRPELIPTAENLVQVIWRDLRPSIEKEGVRLLELSLWESSTSCAVFRG